METFKSSKLERKSPAATMETITEQDVKDWLSKNIGESLFAKRLIFCKLRKNNQKVSQEIFENFADCA